MREKTDFQSQSIINVKSSSSIEFPSQDSTTKSPLAPLLIFIIAVVIRCLPWEHVFAAGRVYLYDPDCYIRLRKILVYLANFPATRVHDYYQGFPVGTGVISPPTMEYLIALISFPFRNLPHLDRYLEYFTAIVPPLVGGFTVLLLYRIVSERFGRAPGAFAALLLATLPAHIDVTVLGRFDNEMVEPLLFLFLLHLYLGTFRETSGYSIWLSAGAITALFLTIWRGALLPISIIGIDLTARILSKDKPAKEAVPPARGGAVMYLTAASIIALICITNIWGTGMIFNASIVSWFHVAAFVAAALFLLLIYYLVNRGVQKTLIIAILTVIVAAGALTAFKLQNSAWFQVFSGTNPWLDSIEQYQRGWNITAMIKRHGGAPFLAILAIPLILADASEKFRWRRFFLLWTVFTLAIAMLRERFGAYYALNCAFMVGAGLYVLFKGNHSRKWVSSRILQLVTIALLILIQTPTIPFIKTLSTSGIAFPIRGDIEETMLWLRDHTPVPGNPYLPQQIPGYGIMARWDYGGWLETIAQRPSIATNFGTETYGMTEVARFLLTTEEKEMAAVLNRNRVRYLVVDKVIGDLPMYAGLIGMQKEFFIERQDSAQGTISFVPAPAMFELISSRLFFADGSLRNAGRSTFQPVEGVRLVHESRSNANVLGFPWEIKRLKVFEVAEGATTIVRTRPGAMVTLAQPVETDQGRRFVYVNKKKASPDGSVRFAILYPPRTTSEMTGAVAPATISSEGRTVEIFPTTIDVAKKRVFDVSMR